MSVLSDQDIKNSLKSGSLVITPIFSDTVRENGVDLRISDTIKRIVSGNGVLDPENMSEDQIQKFYAEEKGDSFIIWPNEHILLKTMERIKMPDDVVGFVNLRSSFARLGLLIPPTIIDAGFEGELTIEMIGSNVPIMLKKGTRFLHVVFARTLTPVAKTYAGKYQGQTGVVEFRKDIPVTGREL